MKTYAEFSDKFLELPSGLPLRRISLAWTKFLLASSDILGMITSMWLAVGLYQLLNPAWVSSGFLILEPLVIIVGSTYILVGHYRARNVNQVEELRHLTITSTMLFLTLFTANVLLGELQYPPEIFGLSWLFAVVIVPFARIAARWVGSNLGLWGEPVVVIGNGALTSKLVNFLLKNSYCGMRPVLVVDGKMLDHSESPKGDFPVPIIPLTGLANTLDIGTQMGIRTAIVVAPDLPATISDAFARGEHLGFSHIITITRQFITRNFGLTTLDFGGILGGVLGFEESHYELDVFEDRLIRVFDLFLITAMLPVLAVVFLGIAIAIKLDSGGSVFYRQKRIGKGGRVFRVLKFRTMAENADVVLAKFLAENPEMLAEWNADHKLRDDPRITRIGKFLRKSSLDELPQLWNVLIGEMSLIGPRPIVHDEIARYADRFIYYTQVPPGISGLWQVSGRNDVDYEQRVSLDEYYVRNRSIWMNLYIMARTVLVVIQRNGAY